MLTPSGCTQAQFNAAAVATTRKLRARATITWTDPYIDATITASAPGCENRIHSVNASLIKQVADIKETVPYKWFHLEGTTPLSAGMHPMPGTAEAALDYQVGWWGKDRCDGSGVFAVTQAIQIHFSPRPVITLRVAGDNAWDEYPVDFVVKILKGGSIVYTVTVTANALPVWTLDVTAEEIIDATDMRLEITKWSTANRVVKITEFYTSITVAYDGDDIVSMSFNEEMEYKDGSLPIGNISANEMDLALNNVDDKFFPGNTGTLLYTQIKKNRKIVAEIGLYVPAVAAWIYIPMGTYWSGDWKTDELGTTASTTARDRMELLRKTTFIDHDAAGPYVDYTLYDLAVVVLENAANLMPDMEYVIDIALDAPDYTIPYAWFDKKSHFDALKEIAGACMGRVFVDRLGVVQMLGPIVTEASVLTITSDNYFTRSQPANSEDVANRIEVTTQPLALAEPSSPPTPDEVYNSGKDIDLEAGAGQKFTIIYENPPVTGAVAALDLRMVAPLIPAVAHIADAIYYAWGAEITVDCDTAGLFRIKVTGTAYNFDGAQTIVSEDADSIQIFGEQRFEVKKNSLVQDPSLAKIISDELLLNYKDPAKESEISWRGNPLLELADVVTLPEYVKGTINNVADFHVYAQKLDFDGALSASLNGRKKGETIVLAFQDTDGAADVWQDTPGAAIKYQM